MAQINISQVQSDVESHRDDIITFLREIVAIPSMDSQIGEVGERIQAEMPNWALIKSGSTAWATPWAHRRRSARDRLRQPHRHRGHRRPGEWEWDPFQGKIEDGRSSMRAAPATRRAARRA
jgi:hypothetical protein